MKDTTFVGFDVHKETIAIAIAPEGREEPRQLGVITNSAEAIAKFVRKYGPAENLSVCYEAGPCGYQIYHQLQKLGVPCIVVAPSLIPTKPGDRVKTDRRDAKKLARLHRSGDLSPVWVPSQAHEALRDLVRAREDAVEDRLRMRNRISKLLLRMDIHPPTHMKKSWTLSYMQWLTSLQLGQPAQKVVLHEYVLGLHQITERISRLEQEIKLLTTQSDLAPLIFALQALRGVELVTAATIVTESGDMLHFDKPRQFMSYAGMVPKEDSSGNTRWQGSITKTGNAHLRRVIVEAAWHYRHIPKVTYKLKKRQEGLPETVKAIAWKAQHRLNLKYRRFMIKGKPKQKAIVAMARELLGFVWAIAQEMKTQDPATKLTA